MRSSASPRSSEDWWLQAADCDCHIASYQKALELALTGDSFTAEDAAQWGFVNVLTEPGRRWRALWPLPSASRRTVRWRWR
jgi:hypothetical protein